VTQIYTACVKPLDDEASEYVNGDWPSVAREHNAAMLGQPLRVITNETPGYAAMLKAIDGCNKNSWFSRTLSSYVAMREFASADGPSDELFVWLDADLVINPLLDNMDWLARRGVMTIFQTEEKLTYHERYKRDFALRWLGASRPWVQVLSPLIMLERSTLQILLGALYDSGVDLYDKESWGKIEAAYDKDNFPSSILYSDQVLEMAYMAAGMSPESVNDLVGWVSYDADYVAKTLVHFDADNKSKVPGWISEMKDLIEE
jgi:hypothetical protein